MPGTSMAEAYTHTWHDDTTGSKQSVAAFQHEPRTRTARRGARRRRLPTWPPSTCPTLPATVQFMRINCHTSSTRYYAHYTQVNLGRNMCACDTAVHHDHVCAESVLLTGNTTGYQNHGLGGEHSIAQPHAAHAPTHTTRHRNKIRTSQYNNAHPSQDKIDEGCITMITTNNRQRADGKQYPDKNGSDAPRKKALRV